MKGEGLFRIPNNAIDRVTYELGVNYHAKNGRLLWTGIERNFKRYINSHEAESIVKGKFTIEKRNGAFLYSVGLKTLEEFPVEIYGGQIDGLKLPRVLSNRAVIRVVNEEEDRDLLYALSPALTKNSLVRRFEGGRKYTLGAVDVRILCGVFENISHLA